MKRKLLAALPAFLLVFSLISCGTAEQVQDDASFLRELREKAEQMEESADKAEYDTSYVSRSVPDGNTVYITPTGKCYHFDPDCGGKNSTPTELDKAKGQGYRPCKKCAQ